MLYCQYSGPILVIECVIVKLMSMQTVVLKNTLNFCRVFNAVYCGYSVVVIKTDLNV